ncbi:MAG: TIR domain-containing protein [Piscinibacter sp.]|uniref:toll/interleukin-1 receptor domain-containing protein n=1 Tax=Piscinibacter sp. TaxID=1903157 RepID=UPI002584872C|nr:toll/interleukin-1 receptor domain-containing protein [Piscinibacter sp.]MCW5662368.1 TIR domain-containing protein [Piscinibacter sp.]
MPAAPSKSVLVVGTGWAGPAKRQIARLIGGTLADCGYGLVCGNSTGVDRWVAESYCAALAAQGRSAAGAFAQVTLGPWRFLRRGGAPWPGYAAPPGCRVAVPDVEAWKREAIARCDAAVMVGGGRQARDIAMRTIAQGKPVFPLPFMGGLTGNADDLFRQVLRTWDGYPVPGVSRTQFLRLAEPWVVGTGPLANLLRGTLAQTADVFVSYRRSDAPAAAGRVARDLAEHFGSRRVFLDVAGIAPSHAWDETIRAMLAAAKAGIVVIGRDWLRPGPDGRTPRLHQADDVVRAEIAALLQGGQAVFPLLVEGARLPDPDELPPDIAPLLRRQAIAVGNADWDATLALLIREIEAVVVRAAQAPRR